MSGFDALSRATWLDDFTWSSPGILSHVNLFHSHETLVCLLLKQGMGTSKFVHSLLAQIALAMPDSSL